MILTSSCSNSPRTVETSNGKDGWLKGTDSEKFDVVANQLRGFDMAMVETSYRYQELYWAGQDENWEYALYQLEKNRKTIENGLERRPKRAESAQRFLDVSIPEMEIAINAKDTTFFYESFDLFTNACNNCHAQEQVPFFTIKPPLSRLSPVRK